MRMRSAPSRADPPRPPDSGFSSGDFRFRLCKAKVKIVNPVLGGRQ